MQQLSLHLPALFILLNVNFPFFVVLFLILFFEPDKIYVVSGEFCRLLLRADSFRLQAPYRTSACLPACCVTNYPTIDVCPEKGHV